MKALALLTCLMLCPLVVASEECPTEIECAPGASVKVESDWRTCSKADVPHGPKIQCLGELLIVSENFRDGEKHGEQRYFDAMGNPVRSEEYADGVSHGWFRRYWPNSTVLMEETFVRAGEQDGVIRRFHFTGELSERGYYARGKAESEWTSWRPDGTLASRVLYESGQFYGPARYYDEEGRVVLEENYRAGKRHGRRTEFGPDGKPQATGEYRDGFKVGAWTERNGGRVFKGSYRNGRRHGAWRETTVAGELVELHTYDADAVTAESRPSRDVLHGAYEKWANGIKVEDGRYANGARDGVWRTFDAKGELTRTTFGLGLELEQCARSKGLKLTCSPGKRWRYFDTARCALRKTIDPYKPGEHVITSQSQFDAVFDCGETKLTTDWKRFRLYALHMMADPDSFQSFEVQRKKGQVIVVIGTTHVCRGMDRADEQIRLDVLLPAGDTPIAHRTVTKASKPCGLVP